jgi:hypothetical protein
MATFYEVFANISEPRIGFRHFGFIFRKSALRLNGTLTFKKNYVYYRILKSLLLALDASGKYFEGFGLNLPSFDTV